jgi:hypothetical protein
VNQVLLINTAITSRRRARFPLSIMTMAAALEGRYESTLIDGNMDRDARATACGTRGPLPAMQFLRRNSPRWVSR